MMHKASLTIISYVYFGCYIATCNYLATANNLVIYCTVQNFDGENIDEFDEFPAIRQYFPYQNFLFS